MEQASSCEHCGTENDREDFVYYEGDWICPDCYAAALAENEEDNV